MPEPIIKKASLREQVVEAVKRDLQEGVISPGERVTEDALVQRLNVSRTPIRGALSQLAHLGLLQQRTGGGYVVPFPTPAELRDVIKVRKLLEPAAVRIAAEEFGPAERSEERCVGQECVSTCKSRWSPYHKKKTKHTHHKPDTTNPQE